MKKPLLATLGVAGACAAGCAIPLVVPFVGAMSAGVFTGLGAEVMGAPGNVMIAAIAAAVAGAGTLAWWALRRKPAACSIEAGGCSCAGAAQ